MSLKYLFALLLTPLLALAADPWLLPFPDISFDSTHAYFSGDRWTAVYSSPAKGLAIRARDAIQKLPPPERSADHVTLAGTTYQAKDNTLVSTTAGGSDSVRTLPDPTSDAIACLSTSGGTPANPAAVREVIGPVAARDNTVWFGLTLGDLDPGTLDGRGFARVVGGIGWYDPESNRFGRVYSPALFGFRPQWIGARQDSLYLLLAKRGDDSSLVESKLMVYVMKGSAMIEINTQKLGVLGDYLMAAAFWRDTLLLSSNQAVAVLKPHRKVEVWESKAYQAPETQWLYLKTFPGGDPLMSDPVEFLPFKSHLPLEVKAKVGGWLQVVSPIAATGYITADDWTRHSVMWQQHSWNCGTTPCFAHVRVDLHDKLVDSDFVNTAFTEEGRSRDGVKVSFRAGWAREEDLVPVMLAP